MMYFLFLLPIFSLITSTKQLERLNIENKLINHITANVSKFMRPVLNDSKQIELTLGFELYQIVAVEEHKQTMQMKLWLRMKWKNEFMNWDKEKWEGLDQTRLNRETVWTPDMFIKQDVGEELSSRQDKYKTPIICQHDGTHLWYLPVIAFISCQFDVTYFPYDRQTCFFNFQSWTYTEDMIDLIVDPRPILTSFFITSPGWIVKNISVERHSRKYACCPQTYVDLTYTIIILRRAQFYLFTSIIPCFIQMLIILSTFFLPPDSGERIGVVITVLLVFAVYLQVLSDNLPKTSTTVPALSLFYVWAMGASSCSLIGTCFVLVVHFRATKKGIKAMPEWVSCLFIDQIGCLVGVRRNLKDEEVTEDDDNEDKELLKYDELDGKATSNCFRGQRNVKAMMEQVQVVSKLIKSRNYKDDIEEEWQTLAKVFDRLCFILFVIIFLLVAVLTIVPAYLHYDG